MNSPTVNVGDAPDGRRCPRATRPVTAFGGLSPPVGARLALPGVTPGLAGVGGPTTFGRVPQRTRPWRRPSVGDSRVLTGVAAASLLQPDSHRPAVVFSNPARAWSDSWPSSTTAAAVARWRGSVLLRDLSLHAVSGVLASAPIPHHLGCRRSGTERPVCAHGHSGDCQLMT